MPAGTIALTNNSAAVTGTGTSFNSELKANDFVVVVVGGVTYTLGVKSVDSATALTLTTAYGGATTSGLSWTPVLNATLVGITAQVAADVAKAIRGLNLDKANWQQVFTGTGNVTVNLPDGTSFTGPAWNGITTSIAAKMDKNKNLSDVADKPSARSNLGLGNSALRDVGTTASTVASGADARLETLNGKSGGRISSGIEMRYVSSTGSQGHRLVSAIGNTYDGSYHTAVTLMPEITSTGSRYAHLIVNQDSSYKDWFFDYSQGNAYAPNSWVNQSDNRLKENIEAVTKPLEKMRQIRGCTWIRIDEQAKGNFGIGFIAQEIQAVFPGAVSAGPTGSVKVNGEDIESPLALSAGDIAAALHHEAILALMDKIEQRDAVIEELQNRMKAIDGLDA